MNSKTENSPWIITKKLDLLAFILPNLVGLLYVLFFQGTTYSAIGNKFIYIIFGLSHFALTWSFYFSHEDRKYMHQRKFVFFFAPLIILFCVFFLQHYSYTKIILIITFYFSGYHVYRQSQGFASLFRKKLCDQKLSNKRIDNLFIQVSSLICLFYSLKYFKLNPNFEYTHSILILIFMIFFSLWLRSSIQRFKIYSHNFFPLFLFILISVISYTPYIFCDELMTAWMGQILGHYIQYIALLSIINKNKFSHIIFQNFSLLIGVLFIYGLSITALGKIAPYLPLIGLTWVHFFLDGFLFRFSEDFAKNRTFPFIRTS